MINHLNIWVFDVTDPKNPLRIVNGQPQGSGSDNGVLFEHQITGEHHYFSSTPQQWLQPSSIELEQPSNLHGTSNGADYIIITHGDFYNQVIPLAEYRHSLGLRTKVIKVQDLYDEYNGGIIDPQAIHDFLAYAYNNWVPPAPSYVLLVGDGNFDPNDNFSYGETSYIPPYLDWVDNIIGESAADNYYVAVSGSGILPDMHLGRFPVKTPQEAQYMVQQTIAYETSPPEGDWNQNILFAADNYDPQAGNFAVLSDRIADNYLPAGYTSKRVYQNPIPPDYPGDPGNFYSAVQSHQMVIDTINQGALVVSYVGHANTLIWADWGQEMFKRADVEFLQNSDRLSFFVPMTCLDGYYHPPLAGILR